MLVELKTKNKDCFVIGTLPCPPFNDPLHEAWKHCNKMVISWLTRSMMLTIKKSVMWMEFALIYGPIFFNYSLMGINFALPIYRRKFRIVDKVIPPFLNITHAFKSSRKNSFCIARFLYVPVLLLAHMAWFPRFRKSVMMIVSSNFFVAWMMNSLRFGPNYAYGAYAYSGENFFFDSSTRTWI